jgi:hypothetical protein
LAPFTGQQLPVHTLPFAFRAPEEDDESVKISNITAGRSSTLSAVLPATRPRASDDATSTVILRPAPLLQAGPATAGISPALLRALCLQNRQFLFDTNKPFSSNTNFLTRRKQSTSFFLFNTNERTQITTHQSLLTNAANEPI